MTTKVSWRCDACKVELGPEEMLDHLEKSHNLQRGEKVTTKKRQIVFADAPGYSMQQWEWIIKELRFIQTVEVTGVGTPFTDLDVIP